MRNMVGVLLLFTVMSVSANSPREVLNEMENKLSEGLDIALSLRDDVSQDHPLDLDKLDRINEIGEEVADIKERFMMLLPDVAGMPFRHVYQHLRFLDDIISLADYVVIKIELGDETDETKDQLKKLLRILKHEIEWLWGHWTNVPNEGFELMNEILDKSLERLDNPDNTGPNPLDLLPVLHDWKLVAADKLPVRIHGESLLFWYYHLYGINVGAESVDYYAGKVKKKFNKETTLGLQEWLTRIQHYMFNMLKQLPN